MSPQAEDLIVSESALAPGDRGRLDDLPDRTLVARALDGDVRSFRVLVQRHNPAMRAYARRLVGRAADADDVVQNSFIAAWTHLEDVRDGTALQGWLFRIVSRKAIDLLRARKDHEDLAATALTPSPLDGPDASAEYSSLEDGLNRALSQLPTNQASAWYLREIAGYSYQEIASDLDLPMSTVRGLLVRARATLIHEMDGWR